MFTLATDYDGTDIKWNGESAFTVYYRGTAVDEFATEFPVSASQAGYLARAYMHGSDPRSLYAN